MRFSKTEFNVLNLSFRIFCLEPFYVVKRQNYLLGEAKINKILKIVKLMSSS